MCMSAVIVVVVSAGETPVRRMLGVLQAIVSGQQPDMRAVHQLHELIVSGDINGDVSFCWKHSYLQIKLLLAVWTCCQIALAWSRIQHQCKTVADETMSTVEQQMLQHVFTEVSKTSNMLVMLYVNTAA